MQNNSLYSANRHACYNLKYHLVVVTKFRHQVLNDDIDKRLKEIATNIFETSWGCKLIKIETNMDHIHILFEAPPQVQLSKLINNFKTVSSRLIRKEFDTYLKEYYWRPYFWNRSYYIGTVSETTEEIVANYIEQQKRK